MRPRKQKGPPPAPLKTRAPASLPPYGEDAEDTEEVGPYDRIAVRRKPELATALDIDADVVAEGLEELTDPLARSGKPDPDNSNPAASYTGLQRPQGGRKSPLSHPALRGKATPMPASAVFAPAAILAAISSAAPRFDADVVAPPDDLDVAGTPDVEERRMLEAERAVADAELDAICAAMDQSAVEELPDECMETMPDLPFELVLCLAPDELLYECMAI